MLASSVGNDETLVVISHGMIIDCLQLRSGCARAHDLLEFGHEGLIDFLRSGVKANFMPEKQECCNHFQQCNISGSSFLSTKQ